MKLVPHCLIAKKLSLAGNASDTCSADTGGTDFIIIALVSSSTGNFNLNFTPSDSNIQYCTELVPHTMICGTAQNPAYLHGMLSKSGYGLLVKKASKINVDVTNTTGVANSIYVGFIGFRVYGAPA